MEKEKYVTVDVGAHSEVESTSLYIVESAPVTLDIDSDSLRTTIEIDIQRLLDEIDRSCPGFIKKWVSDNL